MTSRERFWLWADYKSKDLPAWGDWVKSYGHWVRQGMPPMPEGESDEREYMRKYFGFEGIYSAFWGQSRLPVELGIYPGYKSERTRGHITRARASMRTVQLPLEKTGVRGNMRQARGRLSRGQGSRQVSIRP